MKTFNWLATLWGRIQFTAAMLNAIAFVSMFVIGGLSGIFMAATPVDIHIHDTYFIVGHIHYVLFTGSIFAIFAGIYYWFPKMFGRMMDERLGRWHFWLTAGPMITIFVLMPMQGLGAMLRRTYDPSLYAYNEENSTLRLPITLLAFLLFSAQGIFLWNFLRRLFRGAPASANPWEATTLEWQVESPPPHGNFGEVLPVVHRFAYEYSSDQTLQLMQTEYLYPGVGARKSPNEWNEQGGLDVAQRAMAKVEEILGHNFPSHVAEAVDAEIRRRFPVKLDRAHMLPPAGSEATRRVGSR